jgi:MFS superfamily sulfate permease-like transporter
MFPKDTLLGRIAGRDGFYDMQRFPEARGIPGIAICLVQGNLLFYNADYVRIRLRTVADGLPAETRWFILDASAIAHIDSTGAAALDAVRANLSGRGIVFGVAHLNAEVTELLGRAGVVDGIGAGKFFGDTEDALRAARLGEGSDRPLAGGHQ